jgi:hypothetical protein
MLIFFLVTLSGIIRCSQREAIDILTKKFLGILSEDKLPKRKRGAARTSQESLESTCSTQTLIKRHSAGTK